MPDYTIIIPARYASSRLPGKPLLDIGGKPMLQRVFERASKTSAQAVYVATDDERIAQLCNAIGAPYCMTKATHESGTDRLQEVVTQLKLEADEIIINVQGDEPLIPVSVIEQLANNLAQQSTCLMATLCEPIDGLNQLQNPNNVKVVFSQSGRALYFSRAPIPSARDNQDRATAYRHLGLYAYRVAFLNQYVTWPPADIERSEKLEQLRALYHDIAIHIEPACEPIPPGVDTAQDLENIRKYFMR